MSISGSPPRRRGRALRNTAIGVLVLAALGGGGLVYGIQQAKGPIGAVQAYCADLKAQSYDTAYGLLSTGYQSRVNETDYIADAKLHDQIDGDVTTCGQPHNSNSAFTWNLGESPQSLDTQIKRENSSGPKDSTGSISLVKQGDTWKIDVVADSLQGTDLRPYHLSQTFCADFLAGNYAAAYQLFSAKGQQNYGSEQQFETAFRGTFTNGLALAQCQPDLTTYTVVSPSAQINAKLSVSETTSAGTDTFPLPGGATLRFVLENGAWKVDSLNLNISNA
jgi:hypothetical protein